MSHAFLPSPLRRRIPSALADQSKACLGTVCWVAAAHAGAAGPRGAVALAILCVCIHAFWCLGSLLDGARMVAAAGTAALTVGAWVLIAKDVLGDVSPPLAAIGVLMHMAPAWSQPATPFASMTR